MEQIGKVIIRRRKYDLGIKKLACEMHEKNYSKKEIIKIIDVPSGTLGKWLAQNKKEKQPGYFAPKPKQKGKPRKILYYSLYTIIQNNRQMNMTQIALLYMNMVDNNVCKNTVINAIHATNYKRVKGIKRYYGIDENAAEESKKEIEDQIKIAQQKDSGITMIALDEAGFYSNLINTEKIFKQKHEKIINKQYRFQVKKIAYVGGKNIITKEVYHALWKSTTVDSAVFEASVRIITSDVRVNKPTDQIVYLLDNASYHTTAAIKSLEKELNIKFYFIPPRCPHLNPQEKTIALLKRKVKNFCMFYFNLIALLGNKINDFFYQLVYCILADFQINK